MTSLAASVGVQTIKVYLCGIKAFAKLAGFGDVFAGLQRLPLLLLGIRREQGARHRRPRRCPITLGQLRQIVHWVRRVHLPPDATMLTSAVTLAFFSLLRVSEYTCPSVTTFDNAWHLSVSDVAVNFQRGIGYITIKASKTDPFRETSVVRVGVSGADLCPVSALVGYLRIRRSGGPLFLFQDGRYLTRQHVSVVLRGALGPEAGVNTHSFRIGGASALAAANVPAYQIQIIGRWRSEAFLEYIQLPDGHVRSTTARFFTGPR